MQKTRRLAAKRKLPCLKIDRYRGQWVAIDPKTNKIVSSAVSLREAETKALGRGVRRPIMPVPESDAFFVGMHP